MSSELFTDDKRHGSWAGVVAHSRAEVPLCDPCKVAQFRGNKVAKLRRDRGVMNRIRLGNEAWQIVADNTRTQLHHATGINRNMLSRLYVGGPDMQVLRSTRDRILSSRVQFTPIGIQRRLQALAVIGYSSAQVAEHVGIAPSTLNNMRRREVQFVRHDVALRIVAFYDEAHMTPANIPVSSAASRTQAAQNGWRAPLDWDRIDTDPPPTAQTSVPGEVDEVKVERVVAGWVVDCNKAERFAVLDQWEGPISQLQDLTGWNVHRMLNSRKVA